MAMRNARDATLSMPKLMLPSIQVNMRGGHLPEPEANGGRYLKSRSTRCDDWRRLNCVALQALTGGMTDEFQPRSRRLP